MSKSAPPGPPPSMALLFVAVLLGVIFLAMLDDGGERWARAFMWGIAALAAGIGAGVEGSWRGLVIGGGLAIAVMEGIVGLLSLYPGRF